MQFLKSGKGTSKNDVEIISAYRKNQDPDLIGMLFDRYSHLIFAVSMKYLKNEENSKDAVLKIFEKLPRDLMAYDIQNFSAWIHTVTKNYCFKALSSTKYFSSNIEQLVDKTEEDDRGFEAEYLPHLEKAIEQLKNEQKICIDLFYMKNMSYQEVSDKTGFNMNQVKSFIQNGKRNLKIILMKKIDDKK